MKIDTLRDGQIMRFLIKRLFRVLLIYHSGQLFNADEIAMRMFSLQPKMIRLRRKAYSLFANRQVTLKDKLLTHERMENQPTTSKSRCFSILEGFIDGTPW